MHLIVADDLTGGNDTGIQFVKHGFRTIMGIAAGTAPSGEADLLVINTNTRNCSEAEAAAAVAAAADTARRIPGLERPGFVFKKIDSTLRGNLGVELDVLMRAYGFNIAFFAPSYPGQGRAVLEGRLLVRGKALHETEFARDPLKPISESFIPSLIAGQTARRTACIPLAAMTGDADSLAAHVAEQANNGVELFIFDSTEQKHLEIIAAAGMRLPETPLFVGSAGLAEALAALTAKSGDTFFSPVPVSRLLFICGSAHHITHAQVDELADAGVPVIRLPDTLPAEHGNAACFKKPTEELASALNGGTAVLAAPLSRIAPPAGKDLSDIMADVALAALERTNGKPASTALVLTGGETAFAVLRKLGQGLVLHRELSPGIVLCTVAGDFWDGLVVVTKAGGFGVPKTLREILHVFRPRSGGM